MQDLLNRFDFASPKFDTQVLACALVIWIAVVVCGITGVMSQPFSRRKRMFWIVVIVAVPLLGLLVYLPFSFRFEESAQFLGWRKQKY